MNHININFEIEKAKKFAKIGNLEEAKKVYENINKYGYDYKHIIYDDNECKKFLEENYEPKVLEKYLKLKF